MRDSEVTQITRRVHWFWTGYAVPAEPNQGLAFAKGSADSMLQAAEFITGRAPWLRAVEAMVDGGVLPDVFECEIDDITITERGLWFHCRTANDLLMRAGRELHDDLPHIVPLRAGLGILYATGPEPDAEQWAELLGLARLPLMGVAINE